MAIFRLAEIAEYYIFQPLNMLYLCHKFSPNDIYREAERWTLEKELDGGEDGD
jgi:hypothetical protein